VNYLRDVLRTEEVLRLAFAIFPVGVDEEDLLAGCGVFLVHHQHVGCNACAIEQPGGQADDRV
jgi:hypothetical protein